MSSRLTKTLNIYPSDGGILKTGHVGDSAGPTNYIKKVNIHRVQSVEQLVAGWDWYPGQLGEPAQLFVSVELMGGEREIVACCPSKLYRWRNGSSSWSIIGAGYSESGHRWECRVVNNYAIFNNGYDLPVAYRAGDSAVTTMYEMREQGIARVGCIGAKGGMLVCGDVTEIKPEKMDDWFSGVMVDVGSSDDASGWKNRKNGISNVLSANGCLVGLSFSETTVTTVYSLNKGKTWYVGTAGASTNAMTFTCSATTIRNIVRINDAVFALVGPEMAASFDNGFTWTPFSIQGKGYDEYQFVDCCPGVNDGEIVFVMSGKDLPVLATFVLESQSFTDVSPMPSLAMGTPVGIRNVKGKLGVEVKTPLLHPFTYEGEGFGGMAAYDRYDQRTDTTWKLNQSIYVGIGDGSNVIRNNVYAWAKDCKMGEYFAADAPDNPYINTHQTCNRALDYYIGCYGASGCVVRYTHVTGAMAGVYISCGATGQWTAGYTGKIINSSDNHFIIEDGCILKSSGEEWLIPGFPWNLNETDKENGGNSVIIRGGSTVISPNSITIGWNGWQDEAVTHDNSFTITDAGTRLELSSLQTSITQWQSGNIYISTHAYDSESYLYILNSAIITGGKSGYLDDTSKVWNFSQTNCLHCVQHQHYDKESGILITDPWRAEDAAFRFGGGYLALFGNCVGSHADNYDSNTGYYKWDWSEDSVSNGYSYLPLECMQVREKDGTWRQAVPDDFTITYCATDAEGLAATNGLYDGLAGYTIITAGASI